MWCYKVLIVAVITVANAKNIQEDTPVRNLVRNNQITYYYYERLNQPEAMLPGLGLPDGFDLDNPIVVIIHDHRGDYRDTFANTVRLAIFDNNRNLELNLILMDWARLAEGSYSNVVQNIDAAADDLALFLEENLRPDDFENVILVGFGIGAHLAGIAGNYLRRTPIGQIIGLDPPGKSFSGVNTKRLSSGNALYVEVFHTDGGLVGDGIGSAIGDVDFFVNGGSNQPGCYSSSCCHRYAYELFASSINFYHTGYQCTSTTQVSLNTCRGRAMLLGGLSQKDIFRGYYRVNTPRNLPRSTKKGTMNIIADNKEK